MNRHRNHTSLSIRHCVGAGLLLIGVAGGHFGSWAQSTSTTTVPSTGTPNIPWDPPARPTPSDPPEKAPSPTSR